MIQKGQIVDPKFLLWAVAPWQRHTQPTKKPAIVICFARLSPEIRSYLHGTSCLLIGTTIGGGRQEVTHHLETVCARTVGRS